MITVHNLSKHFDDLVVLKDITTTIRKGEIICIIGPSGTGKSTFLRCLNLLETPTGGTISIDGVSLLDRHTNVYRIRQKMGMVFQSFNLYAHLTVLENCTIGPVKLLKKTREQANAMVMELLRLVGLAEKAEMFPDELSGGQKQRVAIARCMAMGPDILLFDEPTSALDPTMVSEVLAVIRRLSREGMTMIIVTHEMEFARNISTRVFYMDEGIIYEEGPPQQIFDHPLKPKTIEFINRIRSLKCTIASKNHDLYALQAEIERFCEKHALTKKITGYIQLITEEVLGLQSDFSDIIISLSFSEKEGTVELLFDSAGLPENVLLKNNPDDIGVKLIRGRCRSVGYSFEDGRNKLLLKVKSEPVAV